FNCMMPPPTLDEINAESRDVEFFVGACGLISLTLFWLSRRARLREDEVGEKPWLPSARCEVQWAGGLLLLGTVLTAAHHVMVLPIAPQIPERTAPGVTMPTIEWRPHPIALKASYWGEPTLGLGTVAASVNG